MKPIGPYVAARELPTSTNDSAVRTLRATDRLTGVPVLLHVLPYALNLPELPEHHNLLPFVDSGMDGEQAYMVSELPLQAVPATDATLAARGALAALVTLHEHGLPHGGISPAQLWSVDGRVVLAGAGLPWHDSPTPEDDLRALARALEEIGLFPAALRPLKERPGTLDARAALALLGGPQSPEQPEQSEQPEQAGPSGAGTGELEPGTPGAGAAPTVPGPATAPQHDGTPIVLGEEGAPAARTAPAEEAAPPTATTASGGTPSGSAPQAGPPAAPGSRKPRRTAPAPATDAASSPAGSGGASRKPAGAEPVDTGAVSTAAVSTGPVVTVSGDTRPVDAQHGGPPAPGTGLAQPAPLLGTGPDRQRSDATGPATPPVVVSGPASPVPDTSDRAPTAPAPPAPGGPAPGQPTPPVGRAPVSAFSNAPAGAMETPQERRRRQNEERRAQAMLDSQAAARRRAEQLRADAAARQAELGAVPPPIQIGFPAGGTAVSSGLDGIIGEDDLPDWTPPEAGQDTSEPGGTAGRGGLKMRDVPRLPESLRRPADPEPEPEPEPQPALRPSGRLPARQAPGGPIRIGWDEDDSWRVVKAVPSAPARAASRPPRWLLPLLAALIVLVGVFWMIRSLRPRAATIPPAAAAAACCDVAFTLRGAAGTTARLTVESAPAGANLTPGQELGQAPGKVRFPVQGTYRLRVAAEGYDPGRLSLTVPRTQPVSIDLGS